ncbi:flagellar biosynthetic protein FliO [Kordiimonas pumila]|uniref:Flagellar protein n=1 Tax=Kordiimonas pumila TaxID=2161677 RepID=A0ABV7D1L0_9PROT|nr:flagellar biosynthetic protein FliO [Kordiimonas pumila]
MITETLTAFSALFFILAIMGGMAWAIRHFGLIPGSPKIKSGSKQIEILESRMIDGRNRLVVVRWQGQEYLLATNPNGITPISKSTPDFGEMLDHETAD